MAVKAEHVCHSLRFDTLSYEGKFSCVEALTFDAHVTMKVAMVSPSGPTVGTTDFLVSSVLVRLVTLVSILGPIKLSST